VGKATVNGEWALLEKSADRGDPPGFEIAMLGKLVLDGFARVDTHDTMAGSRRMKVVWLQITAAGRKAIG
jgi:hypothetical protein